MEVRERHDANCFLCSESGFEVSLSDGRVVHECCVAALDSKRQEFEDWKQVLRAKIDAFSVSRQKLLKEKNSLGGFLSSVFGSRDFETELLDLDRKSDLTAEKNEQISVNKKLSEVRSTLTDIYDYWPDYPPDWDQRRDSTLTMRGRKCNECGKTTSLHIHHKRPIGRGGDHTPENLVVLCERCHGHAHGKDFSKNGFSERHTTSTDKEALIRKAITDGRNLTFGYKKFDAKRGETRTITPSGFKQVPSYGGTRMTLCVEGHCQKRNATRRFAIKRMYKLKVQ